ncbi:hypothetical protein [Nocardia sp. NPDC047038]|uniref:hypothetical protein n=1 Tax=Nocardia sp. NPDC047038 TaxID=3154338 RepID=UPI0033E99664
MSAKSSLLWFMTSGPMGGSTVPEQLQTREQVEQYLARVFPTDQQFQILETEFGWVCRKVLTPEESAKGMGLGLGNYVINARTGVVTAHSSLPPHVIGQMYDEAIRNGQPVQGSQVYPPQWRVSIQRMREDPQRIEYRLEAESMAQYPEPTITLQLVIDKHTLSYQPTDTTSANAVAWAEMRNREDGTWPARGTFEY